MEATGVLTKLNSTLQVLPQLVSEQQRLGIGQARPLLYGSRLKESLGQEYV